jgi:5-oxoprolinase (ATP-hydrolysing) subunit A
MDLNADLGEGEPFIRTRGLLRQVTSVNIACGSHAGDLDSMRRVLRAAKAMGVRVGAHPGMPGAFGRAESVVEPGALAVLVARQVALLQHLAKAEGVALHHVKLHGALYHMTEGAAALRAAYLRTVRELFPKLIVYARAGGAVAAAAKRMGVTVWEELFADRGYNANGTLVPRSAPGALIDNVGAVGERVAAMVAGRPWRCVDGSEIGLDGRTICVHGDTPGAVRLAAAARRAIGR